MKYSKVHTCDFSLEALLQSGNEFKVCDFCGVKLGVMICYDREFPKSSRILMLKGDEIILVPNGCAYSPIVFDDDGNYVDNKVVSISDIQEEIVIAKFDLDKIRNYRKKETWGNAYRKVEAYKELISDNVQEPFIRNDYSYRL